MVFCLSGAGRANSLEQKEERVEIFFFFPKGRGWLPPKLAICSAEHTVGWGTLTGEWVAVNGELAF